MPEKVKLGSKGSQEGVLARVAASPAQGFRHRVQAGG